MSWLGWPRGSLLGKNAKMKNDRRTQSIWVVEVDFAVEEVVEDVEVAADVVIETMDSVGLEDSEVVDEAVEIFSD